MGTNLLIVTPGKRETMGGGPMIGASNVHKLTLGDADAIRHRLPTVAGVAPITFGLGLVKNESRSRNTMVVATGAEFPDVRNIHAATGEFFSADDVDAARRVVVIGRIVRHELFGDGNPLGHFIQIMGTPFRVVGVTEPRGNSLGLDLDDLVFIPVTAGRRLFNTDGLAELVIQARSERDVDRTLDDVRTLLADRHNAEDVTLVTQTQMLATLSTILDVLTYTLAGIAGISLVVGGIGIMNIMLVSVRERTREIGIRKAVGARGRDILAQFLVESVVLSVLGGAIGIVMAVCVQVVAHLVVHALPIAVTSWAIVLAVSFSAAIGIFFGVYPARRASRLNPIEALRTE
jgi:putative ABC transport system permease protein